MSVAIVDCGSGNLRSLRAALQRIGKPAQVTRHPGAIIDADHVVLPGVGSAASAMATLAEHGIDLALRERRRLRRPILGICLGMQLAVEASAEDGGVACLGLLPGRAQRLDCERVPRMGWANVDPWGDEYYFAHSYAVVSSATIATSEGITAAIGDATFLGVQFHPEKSGAAGLRLLQRCLTAA